MSHLRAKPNQVFHADLGFVQSGPGLLAIGLNGLQPFSLLEERVHLSQARRDAAFRIVGVLEMEMLEDKICLALQPRNRFG